jgi:hypothetical protein
MKKPTYEEPTPEQAKRHWRGQEVSPQRTPGSRDPGLTIIPDEKALVGLVQSELQGSPQTTYKLRNPTDDNVPDAIRRAQDMIRRSCRESSEDFLAAIERPEDIILYHAQYGDMKDAQRGHLAAKYAELIHRQYVDSQKQHNEQARIAQADTRNQITALATLRDLAKAQEKVEPTTQARQEQDGE